MYHKRCQTNSRQEKVIDKSHKPINIFSLSLSLRFRKLSFDFDLFAMGTKLFFIDENQTLEQCGLVPNATLGIREIKHNIDKK